MNNLEKSLDKIAEHILHLDESSLAALWDKYKIKVQNFSYAADWEKAVIIFAIINAVRTKNAIFNENLLKNNSPGKSEKQPKTVKEKSHLKLVK